MCFWDFLKFEKHLVFKKTGYRKNISKYCPILFPIQFFKFFSHNDWKLKVFISTFDLDSLKANMAERLKLMKERSKMRRQLLAQQFGAKDENDFSTILGKHEELKKKENASVNKSDSVTSPTTLNEFHLPGMIFG